MTIESTAKNSARRSAKAERQRQSDRMKQGIRRALRARGALTRFERRWPERIKAAGDAGHMFDLLMRTRQLVRAAYELHKHRIPASA